MLGKLFKSRKTPKNNGDLIDQSHISNLKLKKVFELELVNMEGTPRYRLTSKLGFGSEIGEVIVDDDSISPRHCTFNLEQDVITLIDHNSVNGTMVNNVLIEAGKSLILDEQDEIQIGELLVKIRAYNEAVVREKKASLATLPDASLAAESEELEEELEESTDDSELVNELTKLEDKLQDNDNLGLVDSSELTSSTSTSLLEEKGIKIEELVNPQEKMDEDKDEEKESTLLEGSEETISDEENEAGPELEEIEEIEEDEEDEVAAPSPRLVKRPKSEPQYAANTILRIVALHIDLCLSYGTYLLISPFDDFKKLTQSFTALFSEVVALGTSTQTYQNYESQVSFLVVMLKDLWTLIDSYINLTPTLVIFVASKLIFTLLLGVSLGQFLVGIKSSGSIFWKRVGGVLRTLIGFITFPFLIFDIGAVISRRTLKELITFTRIYSDSKILNIFLSIVFVVVSGFFILIAPLFQGFETVTRYELPTKVEERVRFQEGEDEEASKVFTSNFLGVKLEFSNEFEVFPGFKFEGSGNKTNSQFVLNFFDKKMGGSSQVEIIKNFDLRQLLAIGIKGNPFLKLKFPHIDNFVNQHTPSGFKKSSVDVESFAQEFMEFHRMAMDMSLESYFNYLEEVPLVGSLLDYKNSFIGLLENSNLESMSFIKVGNIYALKISHERPRPHDYLIPITPQGRMLKVSFKGEKPQALASRLYRYAFYGSQWNENLNKTAFDRILVALKEQGEVQLEDAQAIYGFYYELAQTVFSDLDNEEYELLKKSVKSVQLLVEAMITEDSEVLSKLESNFRDLVDAVEIQNLEYFNLSETTLL